MAGSSPAMTIPWEQSYALPAGLQRRHWHDQGDPAWDQAHHLCFQLTRDKRLDHLIGAVGLRSWRSHPFVNAALEHMDLAIAAGSLVGRGELLLHGRKHVVVERALHDQQGRQRDVLASLEYLLRIAFVDGLKRG